MQLIKFSKFRFLSNIKYSFNFPAMSTHGPQFSLIWMKYHCSPTIIKPALWIHSCIHHTAILRTQSLPIKQNYESTTLQCKGSQEIAIVFQYSFHFLNLLYLPITYSYFHLSLNILENSMNGTILQNMTMNNSITSHTVT